MCIQVNILSFSVFIILKYNNNKTFFKSVIKMLYTCAVSVIFFNVCPTVNKHTTLHLTYFSFCQHMQPARHFRVFGIKFSRIYSWP